MLQIGDEVRLAATGGGPSLISQGSLNTYFLHEQGVTGGTFVPIIEVTPQGIYVVQLPSGRMLDISDGDIAEINHRPYYAPEAVSVLI